MPNSSSTSDRGSIIGTLLVRILIPLWVLAGASVKLYTLNPKLLPEPVLLVVRDSARLFEVTDLNWWLGFSLRSMIGVEIMLALVMFASPRLARFAASFILTVFLAVLVATMAMAANRDGISAIWSGSCGCFGSVSPPPLGMFAIDALLLLGVIFLRPIREAATPARLGSVLAAAAIGFGLAFSVPSPKITIAIPATPAVDETTSPAGPGAVTEATGWGAAATELEPFYVADFASWVGSPLSSQPLAKLISRPLPDWIDTDRFHLVLYREDCEHCHTLLEDHFLGPLEIPTIAVAVPDIDPANALPMPCEECLLHTLPEGPQYVISTPVLMTVEGGTVLAVCEDSEDQAAVVATLDATP
ncbi:MAG: hypothetical protein ACYTDE_09780 [Planctomycetota bacterium]|jgi:hypothetical protein